MILTKRLNLESDAGGVRGTLPIQRELVLLTPFPAEPEFSPGSSFALGLYSRDLVESLLRLDPQLQITVLGEVRHGHEELPSDTRVQIRRVWKPGSLTSFVSLWRALLDVSRPGTPILVQFEVGAFGGAMHGAALSLTLLLLRVRQRPATLVIHNMVCDWRAIKEYLAHRFATPRSIVYAGLLRLWLRALNHLVGQCIVLEGHLAQRMKRYGYRGPLAVIPHGVSTPAEGSGSGPIGLGMVDGRCNVLIFGFPGWYKGTDLLIQWLGDRHARDLFPSSCQFVVAGSPNPVHMNTERYRSYLANLERLCEEANVRYVRNVPSGDVQSLFRTTDLLVMPYRVLVGGSGVLALAARYSTPIALSKAVEGWLEDPDFLQAIEGASIARRDLVFDDAAGLASIVRRINDPEFRAQAVFVLDSVREKRCWDMVAARYRDAILPQHSQSQS